MQAMLQRRNGATQSARNKVVMAAALFWIALIIGSLYWNWVQVERSMTALAINEARSSFNKDVIYRRWVAMQGASTCPHRTGPRPIPIWPISRTGT